MKRKEKTVDAESKPIPTEQEIHAAKIKQLQKHQEIIIYTGMGFIIPAIIGLITAIWADGILGFRITATATIFIVIISYAYSLNKIMIDKVKEDKESIAAKQDQ